MTMFLEAKALRLATAADCLIIARSEGEGEGLDAL
jgi:hypothetical protein